jgi:hypothetical protein
VEENRQYGFRDRICLVVARACIGAGLSIRGEITVIILRELGTYHDCRSQCHPAISVRNWPTPVARERNAPVRHDCASQPINDPILTFILVGVTPAKDISDPMSTHPVNAAKPLPPN